MSNRVKVFMCMIIRFAYSPMPEPKVYPQFQAPLHTSFVELQIFTRLSPRHPISGITSLCSGLSQARVLFVELLFHGLPRYHRLQARIHRCNNVTHTWSTASSVQSKQSAAFHSLSSGLPRRRFASMQDDVAPTNQHSLKKWGFRYLII
jgi:hypothetical protein